MLEGLITVVVLTKNEARNLQPCVRAIPDGVPVIVLDSGSSDGTQTIARDLGCRVYEQAWLGFAGQRNHALLACAVTTEWVLFVDADEIYPYSFFDWFLASREPLEDVDVVMVPSILFLRDQPLRYSPGYPIYHPRLVRAGRPWFRQGHAGHSETVTEEARLSYSPIGYDHYFFNGDTAAWMVKHVGLAVQEVRASARVTGHITARARLSLVLGNGVLRAIARFFYHYLYRRGFLDGTPGFEYSMMYAWYELTKYVLGCYRGRS